MPFVDELQQLESAPSGYPFISLYLDVGHDEKSAEKMRVFTRHHLRQAVSEAVGARERSRLEVDARHITAYLEDVIHARVNRTSHGLGIFACSGQKFFQVVSSREPFPSQIHVGERPHLQPLRDRAQGQKRLLVVLVDEHQQRIVEMGLGAHPEHSSHHEVTKHANGGWSHLRFWRHVALQSPEAVQELADVVVRLTDEFPGAAVLFSGTEVLQQKLRQHLPARTVTRILETLPASLSAAESRTLGRIVENVLHMAEHDLEAQVGPELQSAMSPHRGARGVEEVLRSSNAHAVRAVFLGDTFDARGWRCTSCGALGAFVHLRCSYCGGNVESIDLRGELEAKVLASGGMVGILPRERPLTHPVLASLRYVS